MDKLLHRSHVRMIEPLFQAVQTGQMTDFEVSFNIEGQEVVAKSLIDNTLVIEARDYGGVFAQECYESVKDLKDSYKGCV